MNTNIICKAIKNINSDAEFSLHNDEIDSIIWVNNTTPIPVNDMQTEINRLQAEYDALEYARKREAEFPSIKDLVVALYDTDDKSAIETKRAAVKLKYPKPE